MPEPKQEVKPISELIPQKKSVVICGKEYPLREMSLAEKIRVVGPLAELASEMMRNVFIRKDSGGIRVEIPETLSLADLKVEKVLMTSASALPEILRLSVPDFTEWDSLAESDTRGPLAEVMKINDFGGFVANFISLAAGAIRSPKES